MTFHDYFHDYFLIALAIDMFIVLPAWGAIDIWRYLSLNPQQKRKRRDAMHESSSAAAIGSAFGVFDKIIRHCPKVVGYRT